MTAYNLNLNLNFNLLYDALRVYGIPLPPSREERKIREGKYGHWGHHIGSTKYYAAIIGDGFIVGDFSTGLKEFVFPSHDKPLNRQEQLKRNKAVSKRVKELEEIQQKEEHKIKEHKAAEEAYRIWTEGSNVIASDHPYLQSKQALSYGLRRTVRDYVLDNLSKTKIPKNTLLIPMTDIDSSISSLQFIFPNLNKEGKYFKMFLPNGRTRGCSFQIGKDTSVKVQDTSVKVQNRILLCEGYATGSSIHMATGEAIILAFHSGNLLPVASLIKSKYPNKELVVCADNDTSKKVNTGIIKAVEVMQKIGARVCFPLFKDKSSNGTDFNDLYVLEGEEAVKEQTSIRHIQICEELISAALFKSDPFLSSKDKYDQEFLKKFSSVFKDIIAEKKPLFHQELY